MAPRSLVLALVMGASLLGCDRSPRHDLVGTWKSDRAATLAEVERCDCVEAEQRLWLEENLDGFTVEYTSSQMTARIGTWSDSGPYAVVAEGPDWVDLRRTDLPADRGPVHRVWIEEDRMRVRTAHLGFDEVFKRID